MRGEPRGKGVSRYGQGGARQEDKQGDRSRVRCGVRGRSPWDLGGDASNRSVLLLRAASEVSIDSNPIACVRRRPCDAKVAGWERRRSVPCRAAPVLTSASLPAPRPLSLFSVPSVVCVAGVCSDAFAVLWFLGHRVFSSRPRDGGRRRRKDAEASAAPSAPSPVQAASCLSWGGRASEQEQARHAYVYVCPSKPARGASRSLQSPSPPAPPLPITAPAAAYGYGHGRGYGYHDVPRDAQSAKKGTGG